MEKTNKTNPTASPEARALPAKQSNLPAGETREAHDALAYEQRMRPLWATFRNILLVVFLIFVCAVVQVFILWRVCNTGMKTAASLEHQGLPTLNSVALVQEDLAIYRLDSYESLFAQEGEKAGKAKAVRDTAAKTSAELEKIKTLLPEGEGRRLASNLESAFADLDIESRKIQNLEDSDFDAAMKAMDHDIPPLTERVTAAANAFSDYGYHFSGGQANATFDSFGWIKKNAILFGTANISVAFGAVIFVLLAARRSRTQLSHTMARLDERTGELAQSLSLLNATLESTTDGIVAVDLSGKVVSYNTKFAANWQFPAGMLARGEAAEMRAHAAGQAKDPARFLQRVDEVQAKPEVENFEVVELKDGRIFERYAFPQRVKGKCVGTVINWRDVTARKRLEARLFQSQKMETVGKLAGGFAHEFNSILTAIIGQGELLLGDLPAGSPLARNATEISKAANRAAALTRQLLAYGRKQILQPEILDLNSVLAGMESTLRHLMGHNTDVCLAPATGLKAVKADAGQIEQVVMNVVMNACDAMPNGGKLMLETANVSFDEESVGRYPELKPGDYVMLAITDTGTGMSAEVKARVFEPFFTTKDVGQGTGLGLSTCYGIIKQSGGHISVYSEPGRGTTFKIYLPQFEPAAKIPARRLDSPGLPRGTETILLVEDDPALREMAATLLRRLGYTVLAAANGLEALGLKQERSTGHIDLLFTDVVMPHMSGKELADRVRALYPHTKILFTSAYTENAIVHQGVLNSGVALLQKPFTPSALANKLREILDQPAVPKVETARA
jgi:PAS domain S-box-containing protein